MINFESLNVVTKFRISSTAVDNDILTSLSFFNFQPQFTNLFKNNTNKPKYFLDGILLIYIMFIFV